VIPGEAKAEGTIRALGTEKFTRIAERLGEIVKGVELSAGVSIEYNWNMRSPATDNDPVLTAFVAETARELGLTVVPSSPGMGGEDFAQYQQRIKGVFWNIGVGSPEGAHHPRFAVNLSPLSTASRLLALIGRKALTRIALV
jgi:metal-dependent amidase/aminoacylase/carboxypeptidase family protein